MMRKIRKIIFCISMLNFCLIFSQGDISNKITPTTPEMSSLVKRIEIPVNYSSGAINYSLNIYTLKVGDFEIPITLNYISTGFKQSENSSNIGLGWDLEVGGKISHKVNGLDDLIQNNSEYGYFPNGFPVDRPLRMSYSHEFMTNMPGAYAYPEYVMMLNNSNSILEEGTNFIRNPVNRVDTEPDIFYYSFPGKSSKFFLDNNLNGKQIPAGKEKIRFANNGFIVTDIQGNQYEYTVYDSVFLRSGMQIISGTYPYSGGTSEYHNYYLSKIKTKTDVIDFSYDYVDYAYDYATSYIKGSTKDFFLHPEYYRYFEIKNLSQVDKHTLPLLKEISVNSKVKVSIDYKNIPRIDVKNIFSRKISAIDRITIKDESNDFKVFFNHSYFHPTIQSNDTYIENWLKLNSIVINDRNYSFKYYEGDLPQKDNERKDFWGYYCSDCNERYNLDDFQNFFYLNGGTPNVNDTRLTLLKEVIYPTKGSDEFVYEMNTYNEDRYKSYSTRDVNIGIYYSDEQFTGDEFNDSESFEINQKVKFNLQYYIPNPSGGNTTSSYIYYDLKNNANNSFVQLPPMHGPGQEDFYLDEGSYTLSMRAKGVPDPYIQFFGQERVLNFEGQKNVEVGGVRVSKIISKDINNNILLTKSINYSKGNISSGKLYNYPLSYQLEHSGWGRFDKDFCTILNNSFTYSKYYSTSISDILGYNGNSVFYSSVTENSESNGDAKGKITYSFYDEDDSKLFYENSLMFNDNSWKRGMVKKQEFFKSGNLYPIKTITNNYKFLQTPPQIFQTESGLDFSSPTKPNEFHRMSYNFYVESPQYAINECVYLLRNVANFSYLGKKLISAQVIKENEIIEENFNGNILETKTEYLYNNPQHIQPTSQTTTFPGGETQETTYQYSHEKGNQYLIDKNIIGVPLETEVKKNGVTIGKTETIYPASQTDADNKTSGLPLPVSVSTLDLKTNAMETQVVYNQYDSKGNIQQYTLNPDANGNGTPVAIIWGYNQTQPIAKIEGATYAQVSGNISDIVTSSNTDAMQGTATSEQDLIDKLNVFRKAFPNYQVTTYTYNPLIGVTSITPPNGIREVYIYDTANRLKEVREHNATGNLLKEYQYHYKP